MYPHDEYFDYVVMMARQLWPALDLNEDGVPEAKMITNTDDLIRIDALHASIGTNILQTASYDASKAPSMVLDSLGNLSDIVRNDISCLLNVSRIKNLTWASPWPQLLQQCQQLLSEKEKLSIVEKSTALANNKLQYLDLNYEDYRNLRPHEYPGIERG